MTSRGETGSETRLDQNPAGPSCGKHQLLEWSLSPTSRGCHDVTHKAPGSSSIHPLIPLLLCSNRLLPPSPPYSHPISATTTPQDAINSRSHPCYHDNRVTSGGPLVKKPMNAFMLYMKEERHKVLQEGQERASTAINRILGRRWKALPPSEQSKYYTLAHQERLLHLKLHPGWSARDNYGKRKRRRGRVHTL